MGAPKLQQFKEKKKEEKSISNEKDKKDIELLKKVINEKMKNPEFVQKAARILEDMIKK